MGFPSCSEFFYGEGDSLNFRLIDLLMKSLQRKKEVRKEDRNRIAMKMMKKKLIKVKDGERKKTRKEMMLMIVMRTKKKRKKMKELK